jgi:hypothetical protein
MKFGSTPFPKMLYWFDQHCTRSALQCNSSPGTLEDIVMLAVSFQAARALVVDE